MNGHHELNPEEADVDMRDEAPAVASKSSPKDNGMVTETVSEDDDEEEEQLGRITKCYTVFKLDPKNFKKSNPNLLKDTDKGEPKEASPSF